MSVSMSKGRLVDVIYFSFRKSFNFVSQHSLLHSEEVWTVRNDDKMH